MKSGVDGCGVKVKGQVWDEKVRVALSVLLPNKSVVTNHSHHSHQQEHQSHTKPEKGSKNKVSKEAMEETKHTLTSKQHSYHIISIVLQKQSEGVKKQSHNTKVHTIGVL